MSKQTEKTLHVQTEILRKTLIIHLNHHIDNIHPNYTTLQ